MSLQEDSEQTETQPIHPVVMDWASRNGHTITSSRVGKNGVIHHEGVVTSPSTVYYTGLPKQEPAPQRKRKVLKWCLIGCGALLCPFIIPSVVHNHFLIGFAGGAAIGMVANAFVSDEKKK